MTNEATIIELIGKVPGCPISYTCADATTILKGTIMELTGDRTVTANTTASAPIVGIAAHEKQALDGSTTIAVYTNGIFDVLTVAGAKGIGLSVGGSATENTVETAVAGDILAGNVLGYLVEADAGGVVSAVRVLK